MKESDWKTFKKIKDLALEKFCEISFSEFQKCMGDDSTHIHERYCKNYKLVQARDKRMGILFDGLSRSKASMQLLQIRGEGIADEALIAKLSDEFREQTDPKRYGW